MPVDSILISALQRTACNTCMKGMQSYGDKKSRCLDSTRIHGLLPVIGCCAELALCQSTCAIAAQGARHGVKHSCHVFQSQVAIRRACDFVWCLAPLAAAGARPGVKAQCLPATCLPLTRHLFLVAHVRATSQAQSATCRHTGSHDSWRRGVQRRCVVAAADCGAADMPGVDKSPADLGIGLGIDSGAATPTSHDDPNSEIENMLSLCKG
jgi:hypothetical protein